MFVARAEEDLAARVAAHESVWCGWQRWAGSAPGACAVRVSPFGATHVALAGPRGRAASPGAPSVWQPSFALISPAVCCYISPTKQQYHAISTHSAGSLAALAHATCCDLPCMLQRAEGCRARQQLKDMHAPRAPSMGRHAGGCAGSALPSTPRSRCASCGPQGPAAAWRCARPRRPRLRPRRWLAPCSSWPPRRCRARAPSASAPAAWRSCCCRCSSSPLRCRGAALPRGHTLSRPQCSMGVKPGQCWRSSCTRAEFGACSQCCAACSRTLVHHSLAGARAGTRRRWHAGRRSHCGRPAPRAPLLTARGCGRAASCPAGARSRRLSRCSAAALRPPCAWCSATGSRPSASSSTATCAGPRGRSPLALAQLGPRAGGRMELGGLGGWPHARLRTSAEATCVRMWGCIHWTDHGG